MKWFNQFALLVVALAGCSGSSETCSQMVSCATGGGSYELCTTGGSCRYRASDGTSLACASCGDCQAAATKAAAWCSGSSGGGCVTQTVCANSLKDCAAGQRCNTALSPPVCQALYCGSDGSPCAGDSADDLCASRMCVSGFCRTPPDMAVSGSSCCGPSRPGNELGVGKACSSSNDCAGQQANVCSNITGNSTMGFCTMICSAGQDCGSSATCMTNANSGACVPTGCDPTGCF